MKKPLLPLLIASLVAALAGAASAQQFAGGTNSFAMGPSASGTDNTPYVLWNNGNGEVALASYQPDTNSTSPFGLVAGGQTIGTDLVDFIVQGLGVGPNGPMIGLFDTQIPLFQFIPMSLINGVWGPTAGAGDGAYWQVTSSGMTASGFGVGLNDNSFFITQAPSPVIQKYTPAFLAGGTNTPPNGYRILDVAAASDNSERVLLLNNTTFATAIDIPGNPWTTVVSQAQMGWTPMSVSCTPNGHTQLLWTSVANRIQSVRIWDVNPSGGHTAFTWALPSGQFAVRIAACDVVKGSAKGDGNVYLLTTDGDLGNAAIWKLNLTTGNFFWRPIQP